MAEHCPVCGNQLHGHPLNVGFSRPDCIWSLPDKERSRITTQSDDLCVLDGRRHFIRGVAFISILGSPKQFGWGLWVEVDQVEFQRYRRMYNKDARHLNPVVGKAANSPGVYPCLEGHPLKLCLNSPSLRPIITLEPSAHPLSQEQTTGVSFSRVHDFLHNYRSNQEHAWPFDQGPDVAAITTVHVMNGTLPILMVTHYSDDHSWGFVCGTTNDLKDAKVVCMREILKWDSTLREIADLPPGWTAYRSDVGGKWTRNLSDDA